MVGTIKKRPLGKLRVAVDGEENPVRLARLPALSLLFSWKFPQSGEKQNIRSALKTKEKKPSQSFWAAVTAARSASRTKGRRVRLLGCQTSRVDDCQRRRHRGHVEPFFRLCVLKTERWNTRTEQNTLEQAERPGWILATDPVCRRSVLTWGGLLLRKERPSQSLLWATTVSRRIKATTRFRCFVAFNVVDPSWIILPCKH